MTTFYRDADIPAMLADFGVPVAFDGITDQKGIVDYVDSVTLKENGIAGVVNKAITVQLQTSAFPSLVANNAIQKRIVVDGVTYTVRDRLQQTDGAMTHLLCTN
ncbi:head-tail joining protein [Ralstonia insidiosa]|uniref:Uncharacterized protein n=1 Tax=Ralstonia insidiosa TaxID=190721 RepID=A0A848NVD9_9RALS|nr:hypothetical protein [Ralstonia insidiosa]NMV37240.1 hypothetical protein [Ralstonia insidiosa]